MKFFRYSAGFFLVPILFIWSIGLVFDVHFCKNQIKDIGWIEAEKCQMEDAKSAPDTKTDTPPCHRHKAEEKKTIPSDTAVLSASKCCYNQVLGFHSGEFQHSSYQLLQKSPDLTAVIPPSNQLNRAVQKVYYPANLLHYRPPIKAPPNPVFLQVFII